MKSIGMYKGQKGRAPNEPSKVMVYARYGNEPEIVIVEDGKVTAHKLTREAILNLIKDLIGMVK